MTSQKVELIDHMGDDLRVVNAARVSFDKESTWGQVCTCGQEEPSHGFPCTHGGCHFEPILSYADDRLLRYLAKHKHFTPFTHNQITLRETVPIFVARQRFKHVVGFSYNEVSRRYVSDTPSFYTPEVWRKAAEKVKQGSSDEPVELMEHPDHGFTYVAKEYRFHIEESVRLYEAMIASGVCAEQARMVLPQGMLTSYYVTGSLAAFARAYGLRKDPHAQAEIRDLATEWDRIIRPLFPQSWSALVDA